MAREGYAVEIICSSKEELTPREKVKIKHYSSATRLDEIIQPGEPLIIKPVDYAVLRVHNEESDNKDYSIYLVIDDKGESYVTSSQAFWNEYEDIACDMRGEDYELKIYKKESKNFKGKYFITCALV